MYAADECIGVWGIVEAVYGTYKPFRNHLRRYSLVAGLMAVYRFMQFLQFDEPLPSPLQHQMLRWREPHELGLHAWEFLTLARELILNCDIRGESLYSWSAVAGACNRLKSLENDIWRELARDDDIRFELVRIANRQFDWQIGISRPTVSRHYKIISHDLVVPIIFDEFGMSPAEMYQVGMALAGHFLKNPVIRKPVANEINGVSEEVTRLFLERFSRTILEHRRLTASLQTYDINWAYNMSSLEEFPLIDLGGELFCPIPTLFLRRITSGLYYDLVRRGADFVNTYGVSYESYVGEVSRAANKSGGFEVIGSERYGSKQSPKDSIDWIVSGPDAALFVECKASRVRLAAKIDLTDFDSIDSELRRMAGFLAQAYATLSHAVEGQYRSWKVDGRKVYPVVVTLDNWQRLRFAITDSLSVFLNEEFARRGLDRGLIDRYPYTVCSVDEYEQALQVMGRTGIDRFMSGKVDGEYSRWEVSSYIRNFYQEHSEAVGALFDWDFAPGRMR